MYHRKAQYARDLYLPELTQLVDLGEPVDVRGRKTLEILDYCSEITEPEHHCILIPSRRWNPWLAMSEALWILAGRNDVAALAPYNSHISDYSDDGVTLYGAYGNRIYDQIDELIERLKKDPNDRRAVLAIWAGESTVKGPIPFDLIADTKDPPCNTQLLFKLRNNKLHMTVICRSNDIHFGLFAVNIPTFGILQEYIAARLGVELGHQTHISNSLHVYTNDKRASEITDRMLYREPEDMPVYPSHSIVFSIHELKHIQRHSEFAEMCNAVLDEHVNKKPFTLFLSFAVSFLKQYKSKEIRDDIKNIWPEFRDWQLAAEIFADRVWKSKVEQS